MPLIGHGEGRTLGDYSTLNGFGNDSRFAAGIAVACRSGILFLKITGSVQEVVDQQQPVKYEKHSEVVEDDSETGGILCRSARKKPEKQNHKEKYSISITAKAVLPFLFFCFLRMPGLSGPPLQAPMDLGI